MTKIHFTDGRILECESVHGAHVYYNGVNRDSLTFVFPDTSELKALIAHFRPDNTKRLYLEDDNGEKFLHEHYTIFLSAGLTERGALLGAGEDVDHRMITYVKMVKTSYAEQQLEELSDTLDTMLIAQLMGGADNG